MPNIIVKHNAPNPFAMVNKETQRDFKGIWIPKEIWLLKELTYFEKCLFAEIHSLDGEEGCYASNEYLAEFFNERVRKIQEGLSKLKKLGFIKVEDFDGRRRVLRTCLQTIYTFFNTPPVRNSAPQGCGNPHPYNIVYNKDDNPPPPSSKPPEPSVPPASKEEEEEINARFRERPRNAPKIKHRQAWNTKTLESIRNEKKQQKNDFERVWRHRDQAMKYDSKRVKGDMVWAHKEYVEFAPGGNSRSYVVRYDIEDEAWEKLTERWFGENS